MLGCPGAATTVTCAVAVGLWVRAASTSSQLSKMVPTEAGAVKVGDALDMTQGRSRIPFEAGAVNIHSLSAAAVERVIIGKGADKPIRIEAILNNSAGLFQLDELLRPKIASSSIASYVEVEARIEGETERRLLPVYNL